VRKTYRSRGVKEYWTSRWEDIPVDAPMTNADAYPLKYAMMTVRHPDARILEAGCGAGRILRYFHARGYDIVGIDYVAVAVEKLSTADPSLKVEVGDITNLPYTDGEFDDVLAFGLYHNIENDLEHAVSETYRVLKPGGAVCASFRADNVQTRLTDWLADRRRGATENAARVFHKINLTRSEFENLFTRAGLLIEYVAPVENMPILYKFKFFRADAHKTFDENRARAEGYQLSWLGGLLQGLMMRFAPDQFCNIYVLIARKP
jgi:SAM-dependent methyltransferase